MTPVVCGVCGKTVECYPNPGYASHPLYFGPIHFLPASILLDPEPHEEGTVLVSGGAVEFPRDPDLLRGEGVPLRRNHDHSCPRPKPREKKRTWTKQGWRML